MERPQSPVPAPDSTGPPGGLTPPGPPDPPSGLTPPDPPDPPLPPALAVVSMVLFTALGVMTALVEVLLVPLRVGGTLVPVTVALAAVTNGILPVLSRRAVDLAAAAVTPVGAWVVVVVLLSQSRPEGDLLLPAITPLSAVIYALFGVGALGGLVGVAWSGRHPPVRPSTNR